MNVVIINNYCIKNSFDVLYGLEKFYKRINF